MRTNERASPLSLSAVVVGALVGLLVDLGFTLLGSGIGLSAVEADPVSGGVSLLTVVLICFFTATAMVVAFSLGGYVAARCSPATQRWDAGLHGLAAFAISALMMVFVLGSSAALGVGGILTRLGLDPSVVSFCALGLLLLGATASTVGGWLGLKGAFLAARKRAEPVSRVEDLAA